MFRFPLQCAATAVVHVHVPATELTTGVRAGVLERSARPENGRGSRGCRVALGKSIRQCPPITRQSGIILCEKRVESPRAGSVTLDTISIEQSIALQGLSVIVLTSSPLSSSQRTSIRHTLPNEISFIVRSGLAERRNGRRRCAFKETAVNSLPRVTDLVQQRERTIYEITRTTFGIPAILRQGSPQRSFEGTRRKREALGAHSDRPRPDPRSPVYIVYNTSGKSTAGD